MRSRGLTLIELLVTAVMTGFITLAVTGAYVSAISFERHAEAARASEEARIRFESRITSLLKLATLTSDTTDPNSYFIGQQGNPTAPTTVNGTPSTQTGGATTQTATSSSSSDTLVFTMAGQRLLGAALVSTDDFETMNQNLGPLGGTAEVAIETTPVGSPPNDSKGAFLRIQRPADADPSQGGTETLLDGDVTQISFEFFDGLNWDQTWNTQTGTRRLPAAVRISYRIDGDDADRVFIVRLPMSDVTPDNPVQTGMNG